MLRVLAALVFVLVLGFVPGRAEAAPHDGHAVAREHANHGQAQPQPQSEAPAMPAHDGGQCRCAIGGCLTVAAALPAEPLVGRLPMALAAAMPPPDDRAHQALPIPPLRPPRV